jgi:hypothetical protein
VQWESTCALLQSMAKPSREGNMSPHTFLMCLSLPYTSERASLFLMWLVSWPTVAPSLLPAVLTSLSVTLRFMTAQLALFIGRFSCAATMAIQV